MFVATHTIPSLYSTSPVGITSLSVFRTSLSQFLTGGNHRIFQLYDRNTDKVVTSLKGHTKKINHVAVREVQGENRFIIFASVDKSPKSGRMTFLENAF